MERVFPGPAPCNVPLRSYAVESFWAGNDMSCHVDKKLLCGSTLLGGISFGFSRTRCSSFQDGLFLAFRENPGVFFQDIDNAVLADAAEIPVVADLVRQLPAGHFRVLLCGAVLMFLTVHDFPAVQ